MATTKAKDDSNDKEDKVFKGASGGNAPEGSNPAGIITNNQFAPSYSTEEKKEIEEAAEKFQKSKLEAAKKSQKDVVVEQKKKQEEEASKKPTAPGIHTVDNPTVAQSAKETAKEEKNSVVEQPKK